MTIEETPKKRNAAWHRAMKGARREAMGLLDRLGPSADHLPDAAQKAAHKNIVDQLERVIKVIDKHLREARRDTSSRPPAAPGTRRTPRRARPA
jgi:enoyl-CoA hydratase/carnithine racemase